MSSEEITRLKQRITELVYKLEQTEHHAWQMTISAFDNIPPAPEPAFTLTDDEREAVEYVCRQVLPDGSREGDDALHALRMLWKRTK